MIATPNAPPTWRVVSFIAEPTPALARGSEPMIDSVAGAIVRPMPIAMITMRQATSPQYEMFVGGQRREQREPDAGDASGPRRRRRLVPNRSTMRALLGATTSIVTAIGSSADAGFERGVAHDELQVLREQEDRAEHREEQQHDAHARGGEARVLEERDVSSIGLGRSTTPTTRTRRARRSRSPNASEDRRARSSRRSGAWMIRTRARRARRSTAPRRSGRASASTGPSTSG